VKLYVDRIGAAVWATGRAGQELVRAGADRPWLDFRAGIVFDRAKEGLDLGEVCGLDRQLGVRLTVDADAVLARPDVDVVFYAGLGTANEVADACSRANRAGKDAITVSGLVHPRTALGSTAAAALDAGARATGTRTLGTGIWDYLTIALPLASLSTVRAFDELRLERVADTSCWGHGVLRDEGIGAPPEAAGDGSIMRGFLFESTMLLAESLGLEIGAPSFSSVPMVTDVRRERAGFVAEPGTICGYRRELTAEIERGGRIVTVWHGRFDLQPERDGLEVSAAVRIVGDPSFEIALRGELFRDTYPPTGSRAIAAVRPLRALPPGLRTIDELGLRPLYR